MKQRLNAERAEGPQGTLKENEIGRLTIGAAMKVMRDGIIRMVTGSDPAAFARPSATFALKR